RVQSHYLGIVTLGLALAFTSWVTNAEITFGAEGISGVPVPPFVIDLSGEYLYYYLEIVVFALGRGERGRRQRSGAAVARLRHRQRLRRGRRCPLRRPHPLRGARLVHTGDDVPAA